MVSFKKLKFKCPFCDSFKTDALSQTKSPMNNKTYTTVLCDNCDLQFFSPLIYENVYETELYAPYVDHHKGRTRIPPWFKEVAKSMKRLKINPKGKKLLDIGAGDCLHFEYLTNIFKITPETYHVIELDKKSLAVAKRRGVKPSQISPHYFQNSILKKVKTKFDIITATEVLEHQVDPRDFLKTAFAMLKDDGYLIMTFPNRNKFFYKFRPDTPPHHFLMLSIRFFKRNFPKQFVEGYSYCDAEHKNIVESAKVISKKVFKRRWLFPLGLLFVLPIRILDSIRGESLVIVLKKRRL
ncbi:MAG: SAM-dependent methyltransferase [Candidatus Woesearchaeota archaeon]|jgi:SAM-dependent methyltransferase